MVGDHASFGFLSAGAAVECGRKHDDLMLFLEEYLPKDVLKLDQGMPYAN